MVRRIMLILRNTLTRRRLLATAALALACAGSRPARAAAAVPLTLVLKPGKLPPRADQPDSEVLSLDAGPDTPRLKRGDDVAVRFTNQSNSAVMVTWRGLDGVPSAEPMLGRPPVPPGGTDTLTIPLRHAGTLLCDARRVDAPDDEPPALCALVVSEAAPPETDQDLVVLIEERRLRAAGPSGTPRAPGGDGALYTFNRRPSLDIIGRPNDRLRLRFINGVQHTALAIKIDALDVRIIAIDGQPAEPFLARGGVLAMAPGTRIDVVVDVTLAQGATAAIRLAAAGGEPIAVGTIAAAGDARRAAALPIPPPLPSNGLPEKLNLAGALRIDLPLGGPDWLRPAALATAPKPAFRVKRGRTVVLAVSNTTDAPAVFRLHGHHMRLLDRLDDGWKPFWLDTLAIAPGQTQRVAFAAENPGAYLLESVATGAAPRRMLRSYLVD